MKRIRSMKSIKSIKGIGSPGSAGSTGGTGSCGSAGGAGSLWSTVNTGSTGGAGSCGSVMGADARKRFPAAALCALLAVMAVMSAWLAAPEQVSALERGAYTASCNTYYLNPDTGVTDDGGSRDPELGEGMCRSAVFEQALIEEESGGTYVTIRMQLMSNIRNIKFSVQQTPGDPTSYESVSYDTMQEDAAADTADLRFRVPEAGSYIRCDMYVIPMNRDVVYYLNVSDGEAQKGSGDFVSSVSAGSSADKFTDLKGHWAKDAVARVVDRGLFAGTGDTTFSPEASMTRGMFVTVVGRISGVDTSAYAESDFSDVRIDSWYGPYVTWASRNGLVNGVGGMSFAPDRAITQQELAVLLLRYCSFRGIGLPEGEGAALANASASASWAASAVNELADAGLLTDGDGGSFQPSQPATRAQVAAVLARFMDQCEL